MSERSTIADGERGGITSFVAAIGALLAVMLLLMQLAIYGHARNALTIAARGAVERAAVLDGTAAQGEAYGDDFLQRSSGWVIDGDIAVDRGAAITTATGTAKIFEVFPGFGDVTLTVELQAPTERFTDD